MRLTNVGGDEEILSTFLLLPHDVTGPSHMAYWEQQQRWLMAFDWVGFLVKYI